MTEQSPTPPKPTPGQIVQAELDKRGWTQEYLADLLGRHRPEVSNLIAGKLGVSAEMAVALSEVLGYTPEYWWELEGARQLSLIPMGSEEQKRRLRVHQLAPIKDMQKRGWITTGDITPEIEADLCKFFGIATLDEEPKLNVAMRMTAQPSTLTPAQRAWCFRARQLARALVVNPFDPKRLEAAEKKLRQLAAFPKEARHLSETLREFGIRFVVVEPLPNTKIDGAAFWLDELSPAIAVSVRFDRIDAFWFTVMHEFMHIKNGDASVDSDLAGEDYKPSEMKDDVDRKADEGAAALLVPPAEINSFIRRVGPLYSKDRINQFAGRIKMHPGIIVGQLQHRGEIGYGANREMLAKVRDVVAETSLTDGYGRTIAPGII